MSMSPEDIISDCHAYYQSMQNQQKYNDNLKFVNRPKCGLKECKLEIQDGSSYCFEHTANLSSWLEKRNENT